MGLVPPNHGLVSQGSHFHVACTLSGDACRLGGDRELEVQVWKQAMAWTKVEGEITFVTKWELLVQGRAP